MRCLKCMKEFDEKYGVCPHCGQVPGQEKNEPYELPPGSVLKGRYLVGIAVGVGGFGITYRAWDRTLEKMIAIKEYYPSANGIVNRVPGQRQVIIYSGQREIEFRNGKERFLLEARNMAKFNTHPNIVHVFDFFEENGTAYIVMEFLDGISYKQLILANGGTVNQDIALEVTLAVLDALREIHKNGIIHRDISPDNIFICQGGVVKLIDFGAARFSTGEEEKTLSVILKPGYAPPEQYRKRSRQGPWTDIYAVGAMFYRALTGVMPEESVNRLVQDNVIPPSQLNPNISENLSNCIMRAMALNQELRFRNVDQFREAIQTKNKVRDVKEELKRRRTLRTAVIAAIFLFLAGSGGICYGIFQSKRSQATLASVSLTVWYPAAQDGGQQSANAQDNAETEFYEKIQGFREAYPNIEIEAEPIPEEQYEERIKNSLETGEDVPDVFDSSCLGKEFYGDMASIGDIYIWMEESGELDNYYFLAQREIEDKDKKQIPLGFQIPVIYGNSLIGTEDLTLVDSPERLKEILEQYSYSVSDQMFSVWQSIIPGLEKSGGYAAFAVDLEEDSGASGEEFDAQKEKEEILQGKAGYYLSSSLEYKRIQQDMAGIYQVFLMENLPLEESFTPLWSVSAKASEDEQRAGVRLVYYLLSMENQMRLSPSLPLHKKALQEFKTMNAEFAGIDSCLEQIDAAFLE